MLFALKHYFFIDKENVASAKPLTTFSLIDLYKSYLEKGVPR